MTEPHVWQLGPEVTILGIKLGELLLIGFTALLWLATIRLVRESRRGAEESIKEARRIGEAQTRAYVNVKSISLVFDYRTPNCTWIAVNSGQSPALDFVWKATVTHGKQPTPGNDQTWSKRRGFAIPANSDTAPLPVPVGDDIAGNVITVRVRIEFFYTDIFGQRRYEDLYFEGVVHHAKIMIVDGAPRVIMNVDGVSGMAGEFACDLRPAEKPAH
jgi:hypothetical protein